MNLECYYCGTVHPKPQLHVYGACPSYFLLQFVHFIQCILTCNLPLTGDILDGHVYIPVAARMPCSIYKTARPPPPPRTQEALPEVTLTHTGLVHVSSRYATPRSVHELVASVVQGLVEAIPCVEHALQQWRRLESWVCPVACAPCSTAIRVGPGPPLSFKQSFVLSIVLRGLSVWHVHARGTLSFPLPTVLPTRVGPVTNVFACQGADMEEVAQIVGAMATLQERMVFVFPSPRSFALHTDLSNMRWYAVSDVYVIMSWTVTHTVPLGQHNLDPQWNG